MRTETVYIAEDGRKYKSLESCKEHENELSAEKTKMIDYILEVFNGETKEELLKKDYSEIRNLYGKAALLKSHLNWNNKLARKLWENRDEALGFGISHGTSWLIIKGSNMRTILEGNGCDKDTIEVYDPNTYYLEKDSHYTYKVSSEKDVLDVLNGNGTIYCC